MYNANLDRSIKMRKTKAELRRDLAIWEEQTGRAKERSKKAVVEDPVEYEVRLRIIPDSEIASNFLFQRQHKSEFANLIADARMRKQTSSDLGKDACMLIPSAVESREDDVITLDSEAEIDRP